MYEKGSQIVYELDQANRSLKLLKDNVLHFESKVRKDIEAQFKNKLDQREMLLFKELRKFGEFKSDVVASIKAQFSADQEHMKDAIRKRADCFRNLEQLSPEQVRPSLAGAGSANKFAMRAVATTKGISVVHRGGVINKLRSLIYEGEPEPGEQSKPYDFPEPIKEAFKLNEKEAREELQHLHDRYRMLRVYQKLKDVTIKQKH